MRRLSYRQTLEVLDQYGQRTRERGNRAFYVLDKDLPAFKAVCTESRMDAIANLIIPAGTTIHVGKDSYVKCRAERVKVKSIFTKDGKNELFKAHAWLDWGFVYRIGDIKPKCKFCDNFGICESGIHFFIDLQAALKYDM